MLFGIERKLFLKGVGVGTNKKDAAKRGKKPLQKRKDEQDIAKKIGFLDSCRVFHVCLLVCIVAKMPYLCRSFSAKELSN